MLKLKNSKKILLTFIILLVIIFISNINISNATDISQEILDLIPSEISLDIPETEYQKSSEIMANKIKSVLESKGYQSEVKNESGGYYISLKNNSNVKLWCSGSNIYSGIDKFYKGSINNKEITLTYNNTNQKNKNDEQYVKNLTSKLKSPKYYESNLDFISDKNSFDTIWNNWLKLLGDYYTKQINDKSVDVKVDAGAGGSTGLNIWTWSGTDIGIFKNGILYDIKNMGDECTIPIINIPDTIKEDEVEQYIIETITKYNSEYGTNISKIEKGIKDKDKTGLNIDIPNGYTIYTNFTEDDRYISYIIVKGKDIQDTTSEDSSTITLIDNATNVKMNAKNGIIPDNTILEVRPITKGEIFNNIKNLLHTEKITVFDITLKSNGVKIQPNGKVSITIPIPAGYDSSKLVVYRVDDNGNKIEYAYKVSIIDGKYINFETDHFSKYVLAEVEQNEKDDTPKTGIETPKTPYFFIIGTMLTIGVLFIKNK